MRAVPSVLTDTLPGWEFGHHKSTSGATQGTAHVHRDYPEPGRVEIEDVEYVRVKTVTNGTGVIFRDGKNKLVFGNEADVQQAVGRVIDDAITELGLDTAFSCRPEQQFDSERPDFTTYYDDRAVGAIEVKNVSKSKEGTKRNATEHFKRFLGQVGSYLWTMRYLQEVASPYCILTDYNEWCLCWLGGTEHVDAYAGARKRASTLANCSDESALTDALARVTVGSRTVGAPVTPAKQRGVTGGDTNEFSSPAASQKQGPSGTRKSPPGSSPTKRYPLDRGAAAEDEDGVSNEGGRSVIVCMTAPVRYDAKRFGTFLGTCLYLMAAAHLQSREANVRVGDVVHVMELTADADHYLYCALKVKQPIAYFETPAIGTKLFYCFEDLGNGSTGRAYLAMNSSCRVCVLKRYFRRGKGVDEVRKQADAEAAWWKRVYDLGAPSVMVLALAGQVYLKMPFFRWIIPAERKNRIEDVMASLTKYFDGKVLVHGDVAWRNTGVNSEGEVRLFDLETVREKTAKDDGWLEEARKHLMYAM